MKTKCNEVRPFIPMQIYRNPQLLQVEGFQQSFGIMCCTYWRYAECSEENHSVPSLCKAMYNNVILHSVQWEHLGTQRNLNIRRQSQWFLTKVIAYFSYFHYVHEIMLMMMMVYCSHPKMHLCYLIWKHYGKTVYGFEPPKECYIAQKVSL